MKKGFTLVELLSIMVILGIIAVIVLPRTSGSNKDSKEREYNKIKILVENAAKAYHSENKDITKVTVLELTQGNLLTTGLTDTDGNIVNGCVRISKDTEGFNVYTYYEECDTVTVELEVTKNGGDSSQVFNTTYQEGEVLELLPLTKTAADFSKWVVVRGNSIIRNNKLIFGNTDTEIYALWTNHPTLTVEGNGGTLTNTFNITYPTGVTVELGSATKTGYTFIGWEKISGDAILSGNRVTMGTQNTVISARWAVNSYTLTLVNSNATTTGSTSVSVEYDGTPSGIINPEREYTVTYAVGSSGASLSKASDTVTYTFDGWYTEETGGTKLINVDGTLVSNVSGYTSSDGKWAKAENTELYAHWTGGGSVTTATITKAGHSCSFGTVGSNESYTPTSSITLTAQCSANSYTCDAGKYLKAGETTCSSCPAGSYCEGGSLTYSDSSDVGKTACQAGKYTNTAGQSSCTACAAGSYAAGTGNTGCTVCANGKTTSSTGATAASSCTDCSNKAGVSTWITPTWSANSVSNSCKIDACASGYNLVNNVCVLNNPYGSYHCANGSAGSAPYAINYTGNCTREGSSSSWKFKFTTSGTLTVNSNLNVDVFLVGGGGGGGGGGIDWDSGTKCSGAWLENYAYGGGGGAGGARVTVSNITLSSGSHTLTIGAGGASETNGSATSMTKCNKNTTCSAAGGNRGVGRTAGSGTSYSTGGGSGTSGKCNAGSSGGYEFGGSSGTIYGGSGGAGCGMHFCQCSNGYYCVGKDSGTGCYPNGCSGGSGGGGKGGNCAGCSGSSITSGGNGTANTGGGGGGGSVQMTGGNKTSTPGGSGGSGVIIIRKHQ